MHMYEHCVHLFDLRHGVHLIGVSKSRVFAFDPKLRVYDMVFI